MWQDLLVTGIAALAVAVLGWRWLKTRSASGCASCASGAACDATHAKPVAQDTSRPGA